MVYYCSVKGCKNNSKMKKKDPNLVLSFHTFPVKEALKQRWLRAIGRPSWKPPSFARICSAHFDFDQISHEGCRIRMVDDASPVYGLPPNSNFEASDVEVCRMCLAADLKLFSLDKGLLNTCLQIFSGLKENCSIEGLPQFICFECSAHLQNCYRLIEQSSIAQAVLLDVFTKNGQLTKTLVKELDRQALGLQSSLKCCKTTNILEYKCNNENDLNVINKIDIEISREEFSDGLSEASHLNTEIKKEVKSKEPLVKVTYKYAAQEMMEEDNLSEDLKMESHDVDTQLTEDEESNLNAVVKIQKQKVGPKTSNKSLTPSENKMLEFFSIVKLTPDQQKQQWEHVIVREPLQSDCLWQCEDCDRFFASKNAYNNHKAGHDLSRGKAECPICALRFKTDALVKSHIKKSHEKIFYCKLCPSSFYNVKSAKAHHLSHTGHNYKCTRCEFESRHESALTLHIRNAHEHALACLHCGRAVASERGMKVHLAAAHRDLNETEVKNSEVKYPCEECNLNFTSEKARSVHLLTSKQHRKKLDLCEPSPTNPTMKTTCSKCGTQFTTTKNLIAHVKADHPRPQRSLRRNDGYPVKCEHCEEMVSSRWQHWLHVRKKHPEEKHSYRAQHNAVCQRCGKQFQNSTKLHIHELRHGPATVRCPSCTRLFHDKYALARHAHVHAGARKPHACGQCARTFRTKHNLQRHERVHTGETPYGCNLCGKRFKHSTSRSLHVRSVHCNLPAPKRNKLNMDVNSAK